MKRVSFILLMWALVSLSLSAETPSPSLQAEQDHLSESYGTAMGASIGGMYSNNPKANKEEFTRGFNAVLGEGVDNSFIEGVQMAIEMRKTAQQMKAKKNININLSKFAAAFLKQFNSPITLSSEQMAKLNSDFQAEVKLVEEHAAKNDPIVKAGEEYIANLLASDKGYKKTASGLVYKITEQGVGPNFKETDRVRVKYKGMHVDGTTFDSSDKPITFDLNRVVPGFREAILLMRQGAMMTAVMPPSIAYGSRATGPIKANETLIFEIETVGLDNEGSLQK